MAYDKTVTGKLFSGSANENLYICDTVTGSHGPYVVHGVTGRATGSSQNPMSGHEIWDFAAYTIGCTVAGGATGGSYTIVLTGTAAGYTGLPIAHATLGPNSLVVPMTNYFGSASIVPTGLSIVQGATGLLSYDLYFDAKGYRGTLSNVSKHSSRTIQGAIETVASLDADRTDAISVAGTTANSMGMHKLKMIDHPMYWLVIGAGLTGTWEVDLVAPVQGGATGLTVSVAQTGTGGSVAATEDLCKVPITPTHSAGCQPTPTQVIWTEVTAGGISASVIVAAKTGRGTQGRV